VESFLAGGRYKDGEEVLREALAALQSRENVAFIQEGVDDLEAGRHRPWEEVDAEIRKRFGFRNS
jgi:predicted transcriptional regulator